MGGMGSSGGEAASSGGGGFGGFFASQSAKDTGKGLALGWSVGSGIANAQYNASALRAQADSLRNQSNIQAYMIRDNYRKEYEKLANEQKAQMSMNRAIAMKRGITGASAANVLGNYAAKGQKNLDQLYYNAAMQTAQNSIQTGAKINALEAKAKQYDWLATSTLVGGLISLGAGYFDSAAKDMKGSVNESPTDLFNDKIDLGAEQTMVRNESDMASMWASTAPSTNIKL